MKPKPQARERLAATAERRAASLGTGPRTWPQAALGRVRAGFTLVEMMVVIALIGILTAMIVPEMKGTMQDARLRATSRELINACHLAYSRAVSVGQIHRLRLDPKTSHYVIEKRLRETGPEDEFAPVKDLPGGQGKLDSQITIALHRMEEPESDNPEPARPAPLAPHDQAITFYPDGTADRVELKLEDRSGFRLLLRLNPTTARIQILEPSTEPPAAAVMEPTEAAP